MSYLAKPINRCAQTGCFGIPEYRKSFCKKHSQNQNTFAQNKTSNAYKTAHWNNQRNLTLMTNPLCSSCRAYNRVTPATMVDHVWRWRDIGPVAMKENWFQSLCLPCHGVKSALEEKGIYRYFAAMKDYKLDDYFKLVKRTESRPLGL